MSTRWAPLSGAAAVLCMVVAFAIAGSSPDTGGSDAKIASYYTSHSHQVQNMVGLLVFAVGVLLLIVFFGAMRDQLGTVAFGAGLASAVLFFAAIVFFTGPAFAANDTSRFHMDPSTFRLINDMGYLFWVGAVMSGAVVVFATTAATWVTLPRWFTRAGIVVGVILLFAVFFLPAFVYWLWIIVASVLLAREPRVSAAAIPQPV